MGVIHFKIVALSSRHMNALKKETQILAWNKTQGRHSNVHDKDNNIASTQRDFLIWDIFINKRSKEDNLASLKTCLIPQKTNAITNNIFYAF